MPNWTHEDAVTALKGIGYKVATKHILNAYSLDWPVDGAITLYRKSHRNLDVYVIHADGVIQGPCRYSQLRRVR